MGTLFSSFCDPLLHPGTPLPGPHFRSSFVSPAPRDPLPGSPTPDFGGLPEPRLVFCARPSTPPRRPAFLEATPPSMLPGLPREPALAPPVPRSAAATGLAGARPSASPFPPGTTGPAAEATPGAPPPGARPSPSTSQCPGASPPGPRPLGGRSFAGPRAPPPASPATQGRPLLTVPDPVSVPGLGPRCPELVRFVGWGVAGPLPGSGEGSERRLPLPRLGARGLARRWQRLAGRFPAPLPACPFPGPGPPGTAVPFRTCTAGSGWGRLSVHA